MNLHAWALQWGIPFAALEDLHDRLGFNTADHVAPKHGTSEAAVQAAVRLEGPRALFPVLLMRNNVGALLDERGVPVRYGLLNDTKAINEKFKSSDLIGVRKLPTAYLVANNIPYVGQFVGREIKEHGWNWTGTPRETAQAAFAHLMNGYGADCQFAAGTGTL